MAVHVRFPIPSFEPPETCAQTYNALLFARNLTMLLIPLSLALKAFPALVYLELDDFKIIANI